MPKTVVLEIAGMQAKAGIENYIMNMLREFDHDKIQVDFLYSTDEIGPYDEEILSYGGQIFRVPRTGASIWKIIRHFHAVRQVLKDHPEISTVHIHANTAIGCLDARVAKAMRVSQVIVHSHNNGVKGLRGHILHAISRVFIHGCSSRNFCCSSAAGKWMFGVNGKYDVVPNAIFLPKYKFDAVCRNKVRKQNGWSDYKVIGHIGRMTEQKNHKFIIKVFNDIYRKHSKTRLLLIGDGELRNEIEKQINEYGLDSVVTIIRQTDNVYEYLMSMDLFLFPSVFEGLGIVLVEAQASGLPCLVSDAICDEVKITDLIHTCLLTDESRVWADCAWNLLDNTKERCSDEYIEQLTKAGYEVKTAALHLASVYTSISNEGKYR